MYYTLLQRIDDIWQIAFGDSDKSIVKSEQWTYNVEGTPLKDLMIIETETAAQHEINQAIAELNDK